MSNIVKRQGDGVWNNAGEGIDWRVIFEILKVELPHCPVDRVCKAVAFDAGTGLIKGAQSIKLGAWFKCLGVAVEEQSRSCIRRVGEVVKGKLGCCRIAVLGKEELAKSLVKVALIGRAMPEQLWVLAFLKGAEAGLRV